MSEISSGVTEAVAKGASTERQRLSWPKKAALGFAALGAAATMAFADTRPVGAESPTPVSPTATPTRMVPTPDAEAAKKAAQQTAVANEIAGRKATTTARLSQNASPTAVATKEPQTSPTAAPARPQASPQAVETGQASSGNKNDLAVGLGMGALAVTAIGLATIVAGRKIERIKKRAGRRQRVAAEEPAPDPVDPDEEAKLAEIRSRISLD